MFEEGEIPANAEVKEEKENELPPMLHIQADMGFCRR